MAGVPRKTAESNGVLFVTPEINRSIPGVLKNAIDVARAPTGKSAFPGQTRWELSAMPAVTSGASRRQASAGDPAGYRGYDHAAAGNLPERCRRRL